MSIERLRDKEKLNDEEQSILDSAQTIVVAFLQTELERLIRHGIANGYENNYYYHLLHSYKMVIEDNMYQDEYLEYIKSLKSVA